MILRALLAIVVGYLVGSVDFAVLVARARGVDIYSVGSGNPGTANVLRTMGRGAAAVVMAGDLFKGVAAALLGVWIGGSEVLGYAAGAAAVVGHCFPVWHRFRGGKGVATGAGMMLALAWPSFLAIFGVWLLVVALTRVSSLASMAAALLAVPSLLLVRPEPLAYVFTGIVVAIVVARHLPNIRRLLRGEERTVSPTDVDAEPAPETDPK